MAGDINSLNLLVIHPFSDMILEIVLLPEASSTMRALASARCTGVRLYT